VAALAVAALAAPDKAACGAPKTNAPPKLNIQDGPLRKEVKAATSYAPIVKKVAPSVVNIYSTVTIRERSYSLFDDPILRRFFGDEFGGRGQPRARKAESLGSGVIVSNDGYILTANHVVDGAEKVRVALANGEKEFDARIVGTDPQTDVAVLKVDADDLPAVAIGNSDLLEVGDAVLAVGNPFNVGSTVTMGLVSALGRGGLDITAYENFIQTDAAINQGNSGGALLDAEGRLVGINTAILSRSGGFQGVGFAVPINLARYVMERLITEGKVVRGYLGLRLQPELSPDLVKQLELPNNSGALVTNVDPNSPAARAGFKDGDFVTEFNGKKVSDTRRLRLMVSQERPGTKATITIWRGGKERTLNATLGEIPAQFTGPDRRSQPGGRNQTTTDSLHGVGVENLDSKTRREADVPAEVRGALVTDVDQDSNAAEAGLRPGDVIVEIDRTAVRSAEDAVALSDKAKGERILLRIWRGDGSGRGGMLYLSVDNTKRK
jgi:serine protease Do